MQDNFKELKCAEMRKRNISLAAENRQVNEKLASLDAQLEIYMHSEAEVSQMLRQEQNKVIGELHITTSSLNSYRINYTG